MNTAAKEMLPLVKVAMPPSAQLLPALEAVLYSGMIAEGEQVYAFERSFCEKFNVSNFLATNSGTGALHLALEIAGAGSGSEVITTSMTAEPTNTAIMQTGAKPVFADVDPLSGNLSPDSVAAAITDNTVAICVVHYAGYPADLLGLRAIADRHGIALVEDCAHALGAAVGGHPIGSIGDSAIFSFQAIKHMTTIDGGGLVVRNPSQLLVAKQLRWFGLSKGVPRTEVDLVRPGYKYNMSNVAGMIGLEQLRDVTARIDRHKANGQFFDQSFKEVAGIEAASVTPESDPSYWIYTLLSDDSDDVIATLEAIGVSASKLHRPNHYHTAFAPFAGALPGLDLFYRRLVHIPCGWWVSDEDRDAIVRCLAKG